MSSAAGRDATSSTERGETLLELLVAVLLMGTSVLALVGGIGTGIRISDIHRKQATAGAYVRAYAEAIEGAVAQSPSAYVECAGPAAYVSAFSIGDPKYAASVVDVTYWDGSAFSSSCVAGSDTGVQLVSLRVTSSDDLVAESLDVVIRRPCRSVTEFPLDAPCD